jgi:AcrR family transcriptional regulator
MAYSRRDLPTTTKARKRGDGIERGDVIRHALEIADREGLAGLTMLRLAQDLGVSLATLYASAGSKPAILTGLIEEVLSDLEVDVQAPDEDDTQALLRVWTHAHSLLVAHPAVAQLAATQPLTFSGGAVDDVLEETLRRLERAGLDPTAAVHAYTVVRSYLIGFTVLRLAQIEQLDEGRLRRLEDVRRLPPERFSSIQRSASQLFGTQLSDSQFAEGLRPIVRDLITRGRQPSPRPDEIGDLGEQIDL